MNMLLLTTPAQHDGSNPSVLLNEKDLQKWLTELPMMNVVETVKALHQALVPFNELQMDDSLRLKLLEHYRQAIDEIFYSYDEMRLKQLPVSNEVRQELKADIMWLYLELANGYKIVVKHALDAGLTPRKDSSLLLAIYRSMEQIIHALVNAYRNHQASPPLAYLEINQLYLIAEAHAATDKKVNSAKRESAVPTISNLYKQFILLAIAEPMNMPEGMAFDLFFILEQFARQCSISDMPASSHWIYMINLREASLPRRLSQSGDTKADADIRYFDADAVNQVIEARIEELQQVEQGMMEAQEAKLLQFYNQRINDTATVTTTTTGTKAGSKQVHLSFGLEATHYFMSDGHYAAYQAAGTESFGIEVRDIDERDDLNELEDWYISETDRNGKMLVAPYDISRQDIEIGTLVGIYEQSGNDKPPVFTLATVRWLPVDESEGEKIGLQIIPGRPQPVICADPQTESNYPCLHLPPVTVMKQPASLIVPGTLYQKGKSLDLQVIDGRRSIELLDIIDQTAFVTRCLYQ